MEVPEIGLIVPVEITNSDMPPEPDANPPWLKNSLSPVPLNSNPNRSPLIEYVFSLR